MEVTQLQRVASQVRRDAILMTSGVKSGHPGGSMSAADLMTALFFDVMHASPETLNSEGRGEDVFYLSNGHISPAFYSVLARRGYFPVGELATFRQLGSRLQGHPSPVTGLPGVRVASGSLGQGVSVAIGHALAKRIDCDNNCVFVITGDGELQEGQIWEAAQFAASRRVDNLVMVVDWNNQQIDGSCDQVSPLLDLAAKFEAFGWRVLGVDGHNMNEVVSTLSRARNVECGNGRPVVVLAKTVMGQGVDFMSGTNEYHGKVTNAEQTILALGQLDETLGDY